MNNNNKISDLSGLAILSYKEGDSPIRLGEVAIDLPFKAFDGVKLSSLSLATVSNAKLDGILRRQLDEKYKCQWNGQYKTNIKRRNPQKFQQTTSTLVKHVNENTFMTKLTPNVVEFITGKKAKWTNKGIVLPELTLEQTIVCTLAEFALDKFKTLNGIELKCSFYQGGEVNWKSKY